MINIELTVAIMAMIAIEFGELHRIDGVDRFAIDIEPAIAVPVPAACLTAIAGENKFSGSNFPLAFCAGISKSDWNRLSPASSLP